MDEAEYCGRISLIYNGKLIEIGSPYDLKDKYKTKSLDKLFVKLIREYDL